MSMFHQCAFPIFNGKAIQQVEFVIRDDRNDDIVHELVLDGTKLMVEDWSQDQCPSVVIQKRGCVYVVTADKSGPEALPGYYYMAVKALNQHQAAQNRSHPFL